MCDVQDDFNEFTRIKHFIDRIRDRQILKDKIISVKTKKVQKIIFIFSSLKWQPIRSKRV